MEKPSIPYSVDKIEPENLRAGFKLAVMERIDPTHHRIDLHQIRPEKKALLVVSLKSAFYLTDEKIKLVSNICQIRQEDLSVIVHELIEDLFLRVERKRALEEKRNRYYYDYLKFGNQSKDKSLSKEQIEYFTLKAQIAKKRLEAINEKLLSKGAINIRPSNKAVANAIGISERQTSYYIKLARETDYYNLVFKNEPYLNNLEA